MSGLGGVWSGGCLVPGGCAGQVGGVWFQGGLVPGGCLVRLGVCAGQVPPPPMNRMTNRCKNITLAKTSFRPVKIA